MADPLNDILKYLNQTSTVPGASRPSGREHADALLTGLREKGYVPGLAVKALYRGEEWFSAGYGLADLGQGIPVDPQRSVFRVASISKPVTSAALASMVSEGALDLEDPIGTYVPEFPRSHGPVTLRQLASHTAGIRSYRGKEFALNRPMSIADSLALFVEDPLQFPPGTGYHYSSFDYVLLSLAMERAAGMPFDELVYRRVLEPLQMEDTAVETPGRPVPGQVAFYTRAARAFREATPVDTRFKLAGGGYLSTVSDICRFGRACLSGRAIPPALWPDFLTAGQVDGLSTFYGLGWEVSRDHKGRPFFGHTGNAVGAYTNFKLYPDQQFVLALLINASVPGVQPVLDAVAEALLSSLPAPA
jgi:CubicO group peptidase (beta-lactamase class C family)